MSRRSRPRNLFLPVSVHCEAEYCGVDAVGGLITLRLRQIDSEGNLIQEMFMFLSPEQARAYAGDILLKADTADAHNL